MGTKLEIQLKKLEAMTVGQLTRQFEEVFGEQCRSRHKRYLVRRIAWRLQAIAEGDLSERARERAAELALGADVRVTAPRDATESKHAPAPAAKSGDPRLPAPGNWLERSYKGRSIRVLVIRDGFEYEGKRFKSLSAIAKTVTGTHINGFLFFRLWGGK